MGILIRRQLFRTIGVAFIIVLLTSSLVAAQAGNQKIILLRHSTGGNLFQQGDVKDWVSDYNSKNGTSYDISMRAYPDSPYDWKNYPYDYWNLWVNPDSPAKASNPSIDTLESLAEDYDMIVFKHCFPGSGIEADTGSASVSSSAKRLENYKLQYKALREKFDTMPDTIFMVWTLAPLHRLNTTTSDAKRAAEFVDWVKNTWLTEDGKNHPNIFIFDFWGNVAETSGNPSNGKTNTLRYAYEASHSSSDSHPNSTANKTVGPIFAQRVVDVIEAFEAADSNSDSDTTKISPPTSLRIISSQ
ncbi:MAG: hypothetical protein PVI90_06480 [Desulfobacteraceae bacterium]|jgi:hypothetical protein